MRDRVTRTARRVYSQVVQRRQQIRIVRAVAPTLDRHQAFILGVQRSGTTPLRLSLDAHPRLACPPESQFLLPMLALTAEPIVVEGLKGLGFDTGSFSAEIASFADTILNSYADVAKPDATYWVDKTPQYVAVAPRLVALFPSALFVAIIRAPGWQMQSFTNGGRYRPPPLDPNLPILDAAADFWADGVRSIAHAVRLAGERAIVISYERLCESADAVLADLCDHLSVEPVDNLSAYADVDHVRGLEGSKAFEFGSVRQIKRRLPKWATQDRTVPVQRAFDLASLLGYEDGFAVSAPTAIDSRLRSLVPEV